jgi:hypothetical protein
MKDAKLKKHTISWQLINMKQIFKKILYFSEIYPIKFMEAYENELSVQNFKKTYKIKSLPMSEMWTPEYLKKLDENFTTLSEHTYNEEILMALFQCGKNAISH